jgi:hypothetical protein
VAIGTGQAARVALLRADEAALPAARLYRLIAPGSAAGGTAMAGRPASIQLTASVSPPGLPPLTALVTVIDASGAAYQIPAGTLPDDGRPHPLTAALGGTRASYPLRLAQITLGYVLPAKKAGQVALTITGARIGAWTGSVTSSELDSLLGTSSTMGPSADPAAGGWQPRANGGTLTFNPGFGQAASNPGTPVPGPPEPVDGQVTLTAADLAPATVPAIATRAFIDANKTGVGAIVPATIGGVSVPVKIVAEVSTFPTVTGSSLILDLTTLQGVMTNRFAPPLPVTQWWLATDGHRQPQALAKALPAGSAITSRTELAAATTGDPLTAAPQQALLAMAAAAALLAICGFWVSIAADVRQRRAENALLAALGVAQRAAAAQLFLEKLLLSVPSAALGLLLGTVVARLIVPAVTLTAAAGPPVPPAITLFDLPQTLALAAFIAVVPALAAALVIVRRPDPAAELRAAEAA